MIQQVMIGVLLDWINRVLDELHHIFFVKSPLVLIVDKDESV